MQDMNTIKNLFDIFADNPALMTATSMPERKYIEINKAFTAKLGYTREDIIGKTVYEMGLLPAAEIAKMIAAVEKTGKIADLELQVKAKDGSLLTMLFSGNVIGSGGQNYFFMVGIDISEQRRLQKKLEEQNQKLENVIESTGLGTWEWNIQTGETFFNNRWAEMLGYTLAELQPVNIDSWQKLTHPNDVAQSVELLRKYCNREIAAFAAEFRMKHKSGHWVWVASSGKVTEWTADGRPLKMFGTHADITDRVETDARIREISLRDPLTNAYNRKYIFEQLEIILAEYQRTGRVFSVALLDIDFFKDINDQHGHLAGDFILKEFTALLRSNLRPYDLLGRYGGEEFIVVSPNNWTEQTKSVIKRILDKVRNTYFLYNDTALGFTFSAGISDCFECGPDTLSAEKTIEMIIEKADNRLYKAKRTGRNKILPARSAANRILVTGH